MYKVSFSIEKVLSREVYRRLYSSTSRTLPDTSFTTTLEAAGDSYTVVGASSFSNTTLAGVPLVTFFSVFFFGMK